MKNRIQTVSIASGLLSIISLILLFVLGHFTESLQTVSRVFAVICLISCLSAATLHKEKAYTLVYVFGLLSLLMHITVARFTTTGVHSEDLEPLIFKLAYIPMAFFMCIWILGAYKRSKWLETLGGKGIFASVVVSISLLIIHWLLWINE